MTIVAMGLSKFQRLLSCDFGTGLHTCDLGIGLHIAPQELPITCSYYSILNNFSVKKNKALSLISQISSGANAQNLGRLIQTVLLSCSKQYYVLGWT